MSRVSIRNPYVTCVIAVSSMKKPKNIKPIKCSSEANVYFPPRTRYAELVDSYGFMEKKKSKNDRPPGRVDLFISLPVKVILSGFF